MAAPRLDSEVTILKTNAAAKKGLRTTADKTEVIWPKPQFGASTKVDNVTDAEEAKGFVVPAGAMFTLGAAIPAGTALTHGMYFPPGTMFPSGVLCPIHQRMVSCQPIQSFKMPAPAAEAVCCIQ
ncbi:uncharacterized protein MKK02DRAFT_38735 [Dioszegia hungarica]|uniref:Uncharacterized protein n=1 Tax=Dioszegia hungarica TaxID=4972 RepID=A0AA38LU16_9TREE|nr:uncharacterized protein MKK02DRAFT_38735 [Dioszegia hungarica]KAI9634064.1 hypothetical protein MKK02DRAFT_38735 [Dioszegia hungarica]